jgi:MFS family permease
MSVRHPVPPDEEPPRLRRPSVALALILACQLMVMVAVAGVNIALPQIRAHMHMSVVDLSWVSNAYLLTFGGLLVLGGRAADMYGRRRVFLAGIAVFAAASLLGALAVSPAWLIVSLVGQGVGAALAEPASLALVASNFPEGRPRNRALAVFATASGVGLAIGLLLGGLLGTISWRLTLSINVPLGVLILVLTPFFVPATARYARRLDLLGAATSTLGMVALVYGLVRAADQGWSNTGTWLSFGAAVVLLVACVAVETRIDVPVLPVRLFADRNRAGAYACTLLIGSLGATLLFCVTQFMEIVLGFSTLRAGVAYLPASGMLLLTASITPWMIARWPSHRVLAAAAAVLLVACLWLTRLDPGTGYAAGVLGPLILIGAGEGVSITVLASRILSRLRADEAGAASGLQQTMLRLGSSLGLAGTVTVFAATAAAFVRARAESATDSPEAQAALTHGIAGAFGLEAALVAVALIIALVVLRPERSAEVPRSDSLRNQEAIA